MAAKSDSLKSRSYSPKVISTRPPSGRSTILSRFWLPAVVGLALAAGGLTGIVAAYELNYSRAANEVAALAKYRPSVVTRVYADDGKTVIGEFALEKRIPLKYDEIPPVMKNAILAVEDTRFYDHMGIDPIRIIGAAWKNLTTDKVEGGSTLTQQLAKNLFWQAGKRPDAGRSCAAGRRAQSTGRILSDCKSSQSERAPRSGARPDGQDWICYTV